MTTIPLLVTEHPLTEFSVVAECAPRLAADPTYQLTPWTAAVLALEQELPEDLVLFRNVPGLIRFGEHERYRLKWKQIQLCPVTFRVVGPGILR